MVKYVGGKSANGLIHFFLNFEFLNPHLTQSVLYIGLKFLGTVTDRAVPFQYSEFPSETVSLMGQIL